MIDFITLVNAVSVLQMFRPRIKQSKDADEENEKFRESFCRVVCTYASVQPNFCSFFKVRSSVTVAAYCKYVVTDPAEFRVRDTL